MFELKSQVVGTVEDVACFFENEERLPQASDLRDALDELDRDRLRVDVIGIEKAGKSSLINAIIAEESAPIGVNPTTPFPKPFTCSWGDMTLYDHPGFDSTVYDTTITEESIGRSDLLIYVTLPESADERETHKRIEYLIDRTHKPMIVVVNAEGDISEAEKVIFNLREKLFDRLERFVPVYQVQIKWAMDSRVTDSVDRQVLERSGFLTFLRILEHNLVVSNVMRQKKLLTPVSRSIEHLRTHRERLQASQPDDGIIGSEQLADLHREIAEIQEDLEAKLDMTIEKSLHPHIVAFRTEYLFEIEKATDKKEFEKQRIALCEKFDKRFNNAKEAIYSTIEAALKAKSNRLALYCEQFEEFKGFNAKDFEVKMEPLGVDPEDLKTDEKLNQFKNLAVQMLMNGFDSMAGDAAKEAIPRGKRVIIDAAEIKPKDVKGLLKYAGKYSEEVVQKGDKIVADGMKTGFNKLQSKALDKGGKAVIKESGSMTGKEIMEGALKIGGYLFSAGIMVYEVWKQERQRKMVEQALVAETESFFLAMRDAIRKDIVNSLLFIVSAWYSVLSSILKKRDAFTKDRTNRIDQLDDLLIRCEILVRQINNASRV